MSEQPLAGIRAIDFTTLLPGPLASLMLARAGAEVIKVEPPGGEGMRRLGLGERADATLFDLLNAGKLGISTDLKDHDQLEKVKGLIRGADILLEQFRPGVMERLGLGYEALKRLNPGLIYCSVSGYGQSGSLSQTAAHDLNYLAETGILALSPGVDGAYCIPPVLAADIAGGSYPAFFNILLALLLRDRTGEGQHLDVSMAESMFPFAFWALAQGWGEGRWPEAGAHLLNGGSPRYRIYRAKDGGLVAVGAIEDKFWRTFCQAIALPDEFVVSDAPPESAIAAVTRIIASRTSEDWREVFAQADCCVNIVARLEEAVRNPHFTGRGLFPEPEGLSRNGSPPPLPLAVSGQFLGAGDGMVSAPGLGEHNALLETGWPGEAKKP